ncbi:MAG: family 16 glycoside hydrolase, partial [Rubripirellula sp.]
MFLVCSSRAEVYTTPEDAKADPDFQLQGEYRDATRGLQAIALGEGEFSVVVYTGGLPGAGWNGKEKQVFEVDADGLESLIDQFEKVERTSATLGAKAPAGAVVLFDGTAEALKKHWKPNAKMSEDGLLMQGCMSLDTFSDYSMHLEFRLPFMPKARGQGRGNSGLYHQGRYETQILDSFGLEGKNNEAGGIYSIRDPDLNMCFPPLTWQTYDVDFTAARFDDQGKKVQNAKLTVRLNGVVVHREVDLPKSTTASPVREGPENGPIYLQDHGNPVRFRNIWVLPRDLAAEARRPIVPSFERFHASGQDAVEGGRLLAGDLNCVACHAATDEITSLVSVKQAPKLDRVGTRVKPEWMIDFIANPHAVKPGTTMPNLLASMSEEERASAALALTNFLVGTDVVASSSNKANPGAGERIFHEAGCLACHAPQDGRGHQSSTSVPLVNLGDKYSRGSLEAFLKDPLAVRASGRMPRIDLGGDNWRHVAQYLTGDDMVIATSPREFPKEPNLRFKAYHLNVDEFPDLDDREPDQSGVVRGLDIRVGKRDESVILRFDGFLPISRAGKYAFRLSSDDGSRLFIDGKQIIDNDGVHPNTGKEASVNLTVGIHEFRVDYFEKSGQQELSLDWSGPGVKSGGIDKSLVMNRDQQIAV